MHVHAVHEELNLRLETKGYSVQRMHAAVQKKSTEGLQFALGARTCACATEAQS